MPLPILQYNDGIRDHEAIGDDLGLLQAMVLQRRINRSTPNAYFAGYELVGLLGRAAGTHYLKKDTISDGGTRDGGAQSRTKRRVIVRVHDDGTLVEDFALLWNHRDGFKQLGAGFFERAQTMRNQH